MLRSVIALSAALSVTQAFAMTDAELASALRKDIQKYVITVKAPKALFHWTDASDITPQGQFNTSFPSTSSQFKEYVDKQGKKIFAQRSKGDRDIAGPGLYMASEPMQSRSYGGQKNFGLIVGMIRPGARILKLSQNYSKVSIPQELVSEIATRGCQVPTYSALLYTSLEACTKVKQLLVGKDISFADALIYDWGPFIAVGCSQHNIARDLTPEHYDLHEQTFVIYNSRMFSSVYGYTHKTNLSGDKTADEILSYLKGSGQVFQRNFIAAEQMKNEKIKAMTEAQIEAFNQKYILGCMK